MSQTLNVTNGRLLELIQNEQSLIKLYEDIRYNRFRSDFLSNNSERLNSVIAQNSKIMKEFFEINEDGRVKMEAPPSIPKVEAVYKTEKKIIKEKTTFSKEVTEDIKVLVSPEIPEQKQQPRPVMLE